MATSGTFSFSMTRDTIIAAALRTMGVIGPGDTPSSTDLSDCAEALNIRIKSLVAVRGLPLWCIQDITIPMQANQATYQVGPASTPTAYPRPLRILQAYLRNSSGQDVELTVVPRYDYNTQGVKTQQGQPNQLFYDPQLTNGLVTLYTVPQDSTSVLHLVIQRPVQDFNVGTDNPDFPQEAYHMLKWALIDEVCLEYETKPHVIQIASAKAEKYIDEFMGQQQDQASVFFTPSGRTS